MRTSSIALAVVVLLALGVGSAGAAQTLWSATLTAGHSGESWG